jgi:hypothetical protein
MKRKRPHTGMSADDVKIAVAALGLSVKAIAASFGVHERTVWTWMAWGAPGHIAIALETWLAGDITGKQVKKFLRKIGKSRDDGDRYR